MKKIGVFSVLILGFVSQAIACPDLSGTYVKKEFPEIKVIFSQDGCKSLTSTSCVGDGCLDESVHSMLDGEPHPGWESSWYWEAASFSLDALLHVISYNQGRSGSLKPFGAETWAVTNDGLEQVSWSLTPSGVISSQPFTEAWIRIDGK